VHTGLAWQLRSHLDEQLRLGARYQDPRVDRQLDAAEPLPPEDVGDGLPLHAAADALADHARRRRAYLEARLR
jgi:hypothetical protein